MKIMKDKNITMKDQQNQEMVLEQIKKVKEKLTMETSKTENASIKFKISLKKIVKDILKKD
jgi:hypothetical protein